MPYPRLQGKNDNFLAQDHLRKTYDGILSRLRISHTFRCIISPRTQIAQKLFTTIKLLIRSTLKIPPFQRIPFRKILVPPPCTENVLLAHRQKSHIKFREEGHQLMLRFKRLAVIPVFRRNLAVLPNQTNGAQEITQVHHVKSREKKKKKTSTARTRLSCSGRKKSSPALQPRSRLKRGRVQ
ncbi:hypothetical protein CEXT_345861 [Caerostris extrusa]|uniref:Ribosomal protein S10 n=1 Tax=Caerostris extrusa TaxID=172846 RepID=A0AAV4TFC3_CAEEX|nr:hypothetical protein CEXT_345861 [Caerostris extrusa]